MACHVVNDAVYGDEQEQQSSAPPSQPKTGYVCYGCGTPGGGPDSHWLEDCPTRISAAAALARPREGYVCRACNKRGGEPDSHWVTNCPRRILPAQQTYDYVPVTSSVTVPGAGYSCFRCGKPGGELDSHWIEECPRNRAQYLQPESSQQYEEFRTYEPEAVDKWTQCWKCGKKGLHTTSNCPKRVPVAVPSKLSKKKLLKLGCGK